MKKLLLFVIVLVLGLSLCACGKTDTSLSEGQLLYDCGAITTQDVTKYEFLHKNYTGDAVNKPTITDEKDCAVFQHYTYVSDWPTDQLHEILVYPANRFTITVSTKTYDFYLHEDGSLTYIPGSGKAKTYQADKKYRITPQKLNKWIAKYDA